MGCSSSMVERPTIRIHVKQIQNHTHFTDRQKLAIHSTWEMLAEDKIETGYKVFSKIFQLNAHVKILFLRCGTCDFLHDSKYKEHIFRFMCAIDAAVDSLDKLEEALGPLLMELGEIHVKYPGFKPEYFDTFVKAMHATWRDELGLFYTGFVEESWDQLFHFFTDLMTRGYRKAEAEVPKKISSSSGYANISPAFINMMYY